MVRSRSEKAGAGRSDRATRLLAAHTPTELPVLLPATGTPRKARRTTRGHLPDVVAAAVGAATAAVVVAAVALRIPTTNSAHSDVVGYPLFADFNASRYSTIWYLVVAAWPALALLLYVVSLRLMRHRWPPPHPTAQSELVPSACAPAAPSTHASASPLSERTAIAARVVSVGLIWGFVIAMTSGDAGVFYWRDLVAIAAIYVIVVVGIALVRGHSRSRGASTGIALRTLIIANALGASLSPVGLWAVSQQTALTTVSDHATHPLHWLPTLPWLGVSVILAGLVGRALWHVRDSGIERTHAIERRALFLIAVPVVVVLTLATLPSTTVPLDTFETGQGLTTLRLLQSGAFPWRDFLPFHGLLVDTFTYAIGYALLGHSAWAAMAGVDLIIVPFSWIALYLFTYKVAGVSWAAMLTVVLLFFNDAATTFAAADRLFAWPLLLILLAIALDRRSRLAAFATGAATALFAVLVPEATYAVPACAIGLIARDAYSALWPRPRVLRDFSLTLAALLGTAAVAAAVFAVLASNRAIPSFVGYYTALVPGHALEGSLPIGLHPGTGLPILFWLTIGALSVLMSLAVLVRRLRIGLTLRTLDFLMIVAGIFTALYYGNEFLGRADFEHAELAYAASLPFLILCAREVAAWLNRRVRHSLRGTGAARLRWPVMYVSLMVAGIVASPPLPTLVATAPTHLLADAAAEPPLTALGYLDYADATTYHDIAAFLGAFLRPRQQIYDFANEPGLYYFVLGYTPASNHFFAAEDYSQATQAGTIADLERSWPKFVIMAGSAQGGLSAWDGIVNAVREYHISEYILDNYQPLASVDGELIYVRRDIDISIPSSLRSRLGGRLQLIDVPFDYPTCAWGDVPEFLSVQPSDGGAGVIIGGAARAATDWQLAEPRSGRWSDYHWMQLTFASNRQAASFTLGDQHLTGEHHDITFDTVEGGRSTYRFPVGACPQWQGYITSHLHLVSSTGVRLIRISLVR